MKLLNKVIPENCMIALHGDTHIGAVNVAHSALNRLIKWVGSSKNNFLVHMGDESENICVDDKRFSFEASQESIPMQQMKYNVKLYEPIADRILTWLNGNHNHTLRRFGNLTAETCDRLGVDYGSYTCKLDLTLDSGDRVFKMYLTHGFGTVKSAAKDFEQAQANMKAAVKKKLTNKASDCLIMAMGHSHQLHLVEPSKRLLLLDDGKKIKQRYLTAGDGSSDYIEPDSRYYLNTGTFLKTVEAGIDTYAEMAGYDPAEIGYIMLTVRDGRLASVDKVVI